MRNFFLGLSLLVCTFLAGTARGATITLYSRNDVSGEAGSVGADTFEVPAGLRTITLLLSHTTFGRASAEINLGTGLPGSGGGSPVIKPTVKYPTAGIWSIRVLGKTFYSGLNIRVVGSADTEPLSRQAGSFAAIVAGTNKIQFQMTANGSFTGRYLEEGVPFVFHGRFDEDGDATSTAPVPYSVHIGTAFNSVLGDNAITGTVSGQAFTAYHAAYNAASKAPEAGRYTTLLTASSTDPTVPPGTGYGTLTVSRTGSARLVGKLADGTAASAGGVLYGGDGGFKQFLLYLSPKIGSTREILSGSLNFESAADYDFSSTVSWSRPASRRSYYAAAFNTTLQCTGNRYGARARGLAALDFAATAQNAAIEISGGGLTTAISEIATIDANNVVTITGANTHQVRVAFSSAAGQFTGSFLDPVTNRKISFGGALFQNANAPEAAGYFFGPVVSGVGLGGNVTISAN